MALAVTCYVQNVGGLVATGILLSCPGSHSGEADNRAEWTDVQKKVIPWRHAAPDADLELAFQDRAARLGKAISHLVVVASLIDKPTNLGGSHGSGARLDSILPAASQRTAVWAAFQA